MADTKRPAGRPAWVDDELFPFQSRFVDIDGHTVHYVDEGSGPTLLRMASERVATKSSMERRVKLGAACARSLAAKTKESR